MLSRANFIIHFSKKHLGKFIIMFAGVLVTTFISSQYPSIFGYMVDSVVYDHSYKLFIYYTLRYACVFAIGLLFQFFVDFFWAKLNATFLVEIRKDLLKNILLLNGKKLKKYSSGEIETRLNYDCDQVLSFIHGSIFHFIACILYIALSLFFIYYKTKILSIIILFFSIIVVSISHYLSIRSEKLYKEIREKNGKIVSLLYEFFNRLQDVKIIFPHQNVCLLIQEKVSGIYNKKRKVTDFDILIERVNSGIFLITQLIIYTLSVFLIIREQITLGDFLAINTYYEICISQLMFLCHKIVSAKEKIISIDKIIQICTEEKENLLLNQSIILPKGVISFNNITFLYNKNVVLSNLKFTANNGEITAIVGKNGVGKSTILNLLCRFITADSGNITIDNIDIKDINIVSLRQQIGYVNQEPIVFEESFRYNLIFTNTKEQDKEIWSALEQVGMDEFVRQLPDGLNTSLATYDGILSGGQRQRISIARVLLKECKVIVFDEPTSALDCEAVEVMCELWKKLKASKTILIVTHQLQVVKIADKVVLLDNDHSVICGTHTNLLADCPKYNELFCISD